MIQDGWLVDAEIIRSPHFDQRSLERNMGNESSQDNYVSLLVIHNISLPPGKFGSNHITDLFLGVLNPNDNESFQSIAQLKVSAHCLIRRDGHIIQYVNFNDRAWHAGVSSYCGENKCNDFSIGIELEGTDDLPYTKQQYEMLVKVTQTLLVSYPKLTNKRIVGHCDIAPGRKTDPGASFDWDYFRSYIKRNS